jgi:hypothetical protein
VSSFSGEHYIILLPWCFSGLIAAVLLLWNARSPQRIAAWAYQIFVTYFVLFIVLILGGKRSRGRFSISRPTRASLLVIEQALETAGLMLGSDTSRGYCLEMISADFLAG